MKKRTCDICGGELDCSKNSRTKYCSDACKMKAHRASKDKNNVTETPNNLTSVPENTPFPTEDLKKMSAVDLNFAIHTYKHDEWVESPEFKELKRRLDTWSIKKLRETGHYIPNVLNKG